MGARAFIISLVLLGSKSAYAGHFEDSNQEHFDQAQNRFKAVAEYKPQKSAIIDYQLLVELNRYDIAEQILKSTGQLWVRIPKDYKQTQEFQVLKNKLSLLEGRSRFFEKPVDTPPAPASFNIWARDWVGIWTKNKIFPFRNTIYDLNYYARRPIDDIVPQTLSEKLDIKRVSLPLYLEGGNFQITDDGICFTNNLVVADNSIANIPEDIVLSELQIKKMMKTQLSCRNVIVFPDSEYPGFFHIDMWMMLIDNRKVVVSKIDEETLQLASRLGYQEQVQPIKEYLEQRTDQLKRLGFKVITVPWPITELIQASKIQKMQAPYLVPRTYTNFQILNNYALVPSYSFSFLPDGAVWKRRYEKEVKSKLRKQGLQPVFLDSDKLIEWDGSLHCVINNVPR